MTNTQNDTRITISQRKWGWTWLQNPTSECLASALFPVLASASVHPGKWKMMAQALGSLPHTWVSQKTSNGISNPSLFLCVSVCSALPPTLYISFSIFLINFKISYFYLDSRCYLEKRQRKRDLLCVDLLRKWLPQSGLSWPETKSQEILWGLPHEYRGP